MAWKKDPVPWAKKPLSLKQKANALLLSVAMLLVVTVIGYYVSRLAAMIIIHFRDKQ